MTLPAAQCSIQHPARVGDDAQVGQAQALLAHAKLRPTAEFEAVRALSASPAAPALLPRGTVSASLLTRACRPTRHPGCCSSSFAFLFCLAAQALEHTVGILSLHLSTNRAAVQGVVGRLQALAPGAEGSAPEAREAGANNAAAAGEEVAEKQEGDLDLEEEARLIASIVAPPSLLAAMAAGRRAGAFAAGCCWAAAGEPGGPVAPLLLRFAEQRAPPAAAC